MQKVYFNPPNKYQTEIVGENAYQKNIRDIILYKEMVRRDDLEYRDDKLIAQLILEDENKFDPGNAVRVEIEEKPVGYLLKEDAKRYRRALAKLEKTHVVGSCQASVFGKRDESGKTMKFGVWITLDLDHLEPSAMPEQKKGCLPFVGIFAILVVAGWII